MSSTRDLVVGQPAPVDPELQPAQLTVRVADRLILVDVTGTLDPHTTTMLRDLLQEACQLCTGTVAVTLTPQATQSLGDQLIPILRNARAFTANGQCQLHVSSTKKVQDDEARCRL